MEFERELIIIEWRKKGAKLISFIFLNYQEIVAIRLRLLM